MVAELSFTTYSDVMDSWERIRRVKDFDKTLGMIVFKKFFSRCPDAVSIYGYDQCEREEILKGDTFEKHAKKFVCFCDSFIDMLGPHADMLTDILEEEGIKHAKWGVKLDHYPSMGEALIEGVKSLDKKFNDDTELSWRKVYGGVSMNLGKSIMYHKAGRRYTL